MSSPSAGADAEGAAAVRRRTMQAVKSRDTKPEMIVRRLLHKAGYRFRLHRRDLPGSPDLVFPGRRKAIFIHGCFWHGHDCPRGARQPKTNRDYWRAKIDRNRERDCRSETLLVTAGWDVLTVWECQIRNVPQLLCRAHSFLRPGV